MADDALPNGKDEKPESCGPALSNSETRNSRKKDDVPPRKSFGERLKAVWVKSGLNVPTLLLMAKGGLPPVIALSMYEIQPYTKPNIV